MKNAHAGALPTMTEALWPRPDLAASGALVLGMSLAVALCAQVAVPLPGTPVLLTGSTFGVLYAGALLGSRRGAAAIALYLIEAACGLPVLAGRLPLFPLGPMAGYLLGFLPSAWLVGFLAERGWDRSPGRAFVMMLAGSLVIFAFGLAGLAPFVAADRLLAAGLYPFIPGDLAKCCLSAALLPMGWRFMGNFIKEGVDRKNFIS